jgi:hypothetical protein
MPQILDLGEQGIHELPDDATPEEIQSIADSLDKSPRSREQMVDRFGNFQSGETPETQFVAPPPTSRVERAAFDLAKSYQDPNTGVLRKSFNTASLPFGLAGQVLNAGVSDIGASIGTTLAGEPELAANQGGNLFEFFRPGAGLPGNERLPQQQVLSDVSKTHPVIATGGKIAGGLVESTPMMAAGLPTGVLGKLVAAGFTADMIHGAGEAATVLGDEMGKPKSERDMDKITTAIATMAQSTAFAPTMAAHQIGKPIGEKISPRSEAIKELSKSLMDEPIERRKSASQTPIRQLSVPVPRDPFLQPGIPELADAALREAQGGRILAPGQEPALLQLRRELGGQLVQPANQAITGDRIFNETSGGAPGGKISFAAPAQANAIPNALQSAFENAWGGAVQTPDLVNSVLSVINNKNRVELEKMRNDLSGPNSQFPGMGTRSQANDMVRLIDDRLKELSATEKKPFTSNELEAIRKIVSKTEQAPVKPVMPEPLVTDLGQKRITEGTKQLPPPSSGDLSVKGGAGAEAKKITPEVDSFIKEYSSPESKISNASNDPAQMTTQKAGMAAKTISDLDALLEINNKNREFLKEFRAKRESGAAISQEEMNKYFSIGQRIQFPREVIETATDVGSWSEANQTAKDRPLGDRPLDWKKNPEVEKWLQDHSKELGIEMPEKELASSLSSKEIPTHEIDIPPTHTEVKSLVSELQSEFPNGMGVEVVKNYHELPDSLHQVAYKQGAQPQQINGAVHNGKVYLVADNLSSLAEARQIWLHEQAGHMATDKILGPKLDSFMKSVAESFSDHELMNDTRSRYTKADDVRLGREFVARLSENPKEAPGVWNKIVADFRAFLRDIGWVKKVSENDIQVLLAKAVESLKAEGSKSDSSSLSVKESKPLRSSKEIALQSPAVRIPAGPGAGSPPRPPTGTGTPASGTPSRGPVTLDDVYNRFEPNPTTKTPIKEKVSKVVESLRTGFSSKFRPLNKLAEDIADMYGRKTKDVAGIFEQLKGSQGKAEADIYRFDQDVSKTVKGHEKDFNAYLFLKRTLDRLNQDAADKSAGKPVRRAVSSYTIPEVQAKLNLLESQLGPDSLAKVKSASDQFQNYMDEALRLQVESGRMSTEVYQSIKDGNSFYAPFKLLKYIEESSRPEGSGARIDTMADFTKAMEGIEDADFKLADMLASGRSSIAMSRILADKNMAMRHLSELAAFDTQGAYIKKLGPKQDAPIGTEVVNVLENGEQQRYAVNKDVAGAVQIYGSEGASLFARALSASSIPFRAGATALNLPFQISNLLADLPRQALVSKYGINSAANLVRYPYSFIEGLYSSIAGDVFGHNTKLFQDFLDSGVAGTTIQQYLTPESFKFKEPNNISKSKKLASTVLNTIPHFANAIEQTSKIVGVGNAMRTHGVTSGKELARQIPEAITELRRFSGSPDFGRIGSAVESARLNLLYMFLNARIQGSVADVGRLSGRDGGKTAAATWAKIGLPIGMATAYLYYLNNSDEYKDDFAKRPAQEKQNYWLIPKDKFITTEDGEKIRDFWRIPKREISKWVANATESALDFAHEKDAQAASRFGKSMLQDIFPVNIQGNTFKESGESVMSGLNPVIKAPLEFYSGRDFYRHRDLIPDTMRKASPEEQYTARTSDAFKKLAVAMPGVLPEGLRSPIVLENLTRNLTAGLFTQFLPRKPVERRVLGCSSRQTISTGAASVAFDLPAPATGT